MSQTVEFTVPDMTCGHCAGRIKALVASVDAQARVDVDLPAHRVRIESDLGSEVFRAALIEADYPPT